MKKSVFFPLLSIAAGSGLAGSGVDHKIQTRKPNIVFILADDIGYGDFSCYGATEIKTPKLQDAGYTTAVVGKWHLGLGEDTNQPWNEYISPGPKELGFDYSYIMAATLIGIKKNHFSCILEPMTRMFRAGLTHSLLGNLEWDREEIGIRN